MQVQVLSAPFNNLMNNEKPVGEVVKRSHLGDFFLYMRRWAE